MSWIELVRLASEADARIAQLEREVAELESENAELRKQVEKYTDIIYASEGPEREGE